MCRYIDKVWASAFATAHESGKSATELKRKLLMDIRRHNIVQWTYTIIKRVEIVGFGTVDLHGLLTLTY